MPGERTLVAESQLDGDVGDGTPQIGEVVTARQDPGLKDELLRRSPEGFLKLTVELPWR